MRGASNNGDDALTWEGHGAAVRQIRKAVVSIAVVRRYLQRKRQCTVNVFVIKMPGIVRFKSRRTATISRKASQRLKALPLTSHSQTRR